jgi:nucleotide-binding universal stress UspA family protein
VAVAPRGYRSTAPARLARIGVGYGAAPEADEALRAAVGLAARMRAAIRVLNVVEPPTAGARLPFDELQETAREALTSRIRSATDDASATVEISGEVIDGYPDDELARLSLEVDLLVCGSSGHGPVASVLTGSISAGILRKARCPVLLVPRGARDGFAALRAPAAASSSAA